METSKNNNRHVVPTGRSDKPWGVRKPGSDRFSSLHTTQEDGIQRSREIVHNLGGGENVIHGRDGRIRDSRTVPPGNDPFPPRDKK